MQGRRIKVLAGAVVLLAAGALLVVLDWSSLRIAYHRHAMASAHEQLERAMAEPGDDPSVDITSEMEAVERHRDALVALGYLGHEVVALEVIDLDAGEGRTLWREMIDRLGDRRDLDLSMVGYGTKSCSSMRTKGG